MNRRSFIKLNLLALGTMAFDRLFPWRVPNVLPFWRDLIVPGQKHLISYKWAGDDVSLRVDGQRADGGADFQMVDSRMGSGFRCFAWISMADEGSDSYVFRISKDLKMYEATQNYGDNWGSSMMATLWDW
jgi:hypothetical protein